MMRRFIRAVVQNATVTRGEGLTLNIDPVILRAAEILPLEEVEIVHHGTGHRFSTYAEAGREGSGDVIVPHARAGDVISILSWGWLHDGQTLGHRAKLLTLDGANQIITLAER